MKVESTKIVTLQSPIFIEGSHSSGRHLKITKFKPLEGEKDVSDRDCYFSCNCMLDNQIAMFSSPGCVHDVRSDLDRQTSVLGMVALKRSYDSMELKVDTSPRTNDIFLQKPAEISK